MGHEHQSESTTPEAGICEPAALFPVILAVPPAAQSLKGREKVTFLSDWARRALAISAQRSGVELGCLVKDDRGAPLACKGWHWSISHKSTYVAAVVAPFAVGIDIEPIRPVSAALVGKVASEAHEVLGRDTTDTDFFRIWTAKEAVLKAEGVGLAGLAHCRLTRFVDGHRLIVAFDQTAYAIEQRFVAGHVAAVVTGGAKVNWVEKQTEKGRLKTEGERKMPF